MSLQTQITFPVVEDCIVRMQNADGRSQNAQRFSDISTQRKKGQNRRATIVRPDRQAADN